MFTPDLEARRTLVNDGCGRVVDIARGITGRGEK